MNIFKRFKKQNQPKKQSITLKTTDLDFIGKTKTIEVIEEQDVVDKINDNNQIITADFEQKLTELKDYSDNQDHQINQDLNQAKQELQTNINDLKNYSDGEDAKIKQDLNQLSEDKKGLIAGSTQAFTSSAPPGFLNFNVWNGEIPLNQAFTGLYYSKLSLERNNNNYTFNEVYTKLSTKFERDNNTSINIRPVNAFVSKWNLNKPVNVSDITSVKVTFGNSNYMGEVIRVNATSSTTIKVNVTCLTIDGLGLPRGKSKLDVDYELLVQFERVD